MDTDNPDLAADLGNTEFAGTDVWNMGIIEQLTSLEGRLNRLRYFILSILVNVVGLIYSIIMAVFLGILWGITDAPEIVVDILFGLLLIPIVYINYTIIVKRLQDRGSEGAWITFTQIFSVLTILYFMTPIGSSIEATLDLITLVMAIPLGIVCLFLRGDAGPNQFGPDPLNQLPHK
tara:strand:- start:42 stop:572 length:531 start_codon:yes stop_codon:yes gene_type:complete